MLLSVNNKLPCSRGELKGIETTVRSGFVTVDQKVNLLSAQALADIPNSGIHRGDTVYFGGHCITSPWYKEEFEVNGEKFILVPLEQILTVDSLGNAPSSI